MPLSNQTKYIIVIALTVIVIVAAALVPPFSQDVSFHTFADARTVFGLPNGLNVLSNLPFIIIGLAGLLSVRKFHGPKAISVIYATLFFGIILTGLGSAYYHFSPNNNSLVFDRIPMTIVFTSFLAATISERINMKWGAILLLPMVLAGIASVLWWHYTEQQGAGDLRVYMVVQFYPVVLIPVVFMLFPTTAAALITKMFTWIIVWYLVAKVFERYDFQLFETFKIISGHSLKHLAAAVSTWYIFRIFRAKL